MSIVRLGQRQKILLVLVIRDGSTQRWYISVVATVTDYQIEKLLTIWVKGILTLPWSWCFYIRYNSKVNVSLKKIYTSCAVNLTAHPHRTVAHQLPLQEALPLTLPGR